jgi:hypothetical protein
VRARRRARLVLIDRLLFAIEEFNGTTGGDTPAPVELWNWYWRLRGGEPYRVGRVWSGAVLLAATLDLQEPLLLVATEPDGAEAGQPAPEWRGWNRPARASPPRPPLPPAS